MSKPVQQQAFNANSSDYKARSEAIQVEINSNKVIIDRDLFVKTPEEKLELKRMKQAYKASLK